MMYFCHCDPCESQSTTPASQDTSLSFAMSLTSAESTVSKSSISYVHGDHRRCRPRHGIYLFHSDRCFYDNIRVCGKPSPPPVNQPHQSVILILRKPLLMQKQNKTVVRLMFLTEQHKFLMQHERKPKNRTPSPPNYFLWTETTTSPPQTIFRPHKHCC